MSTADLLGMNSAQDDEMDADADGSGDEDAVDLRPGAADSSEEDSDDDSEEERQIRQGARHAGAHALPGLGVSEGLSRLSLSATGERGGRWFTAGRA